MEEKSLTEYVCRYLRDFLDGDCCWVDVKKVSTKAEAEAWVNEDPEENSYYEIRMSTNSIMKEQLNCLQEDRESSIPKNILINAYKDVVKKLDDDWHLTDYDEDGKMILPENKPLLLLLRKTSGKVVFHTQIYDSWSKDFFESHNIIAWKIIELPNWLPACNCEKAYPTGVILDGRQPTCDI